MAFLGSHRECNCGAPDSGDTCNSQGGPPAPALCQNLLLGSFFTTPLASKLCTLVQVGWDRILSDRTYQLEPEKKYVHLAWAMCPPGKLLNSANFYKNTFLKMPAEGRDLWRNEEIMQPVQSPNLSPALGNGNKCPPSLTAKNINN